MKKTLSTLTLTLFGFVALSQARLEIGIKAGANFADTEVSGASTDAITSFHGGAYALVKLANIGIQPEVLFSSQGAKKFPDRGDLDLTYVNIPVIFKFYLPFGVNLQAGPQVGILTNAKGTEGTDRDLTDELKELDLSAVLGAGWDAPFGLQLSARYILGLSDISDVPDIAETKNRTFQIAIGWRLLKLGN